MKILLILCAICLSLTYGAFEEAPLSSRAIGRGGLVIAAPGDFNFVLNPANLSCKKISLGNYLEAATTYSSFMAASIFYICVSDNLAVY
jgi:hypothetical protein